MFIGHYALAIVAAGLRRGPTLGAAMVAAQLVDIVFFTFVLVGVEAMRAVPGFTAMNPMDLYHMPYTHSLVGTLGFAGLWAAGARVLGRSWRVAWIGALVVASHWFVDLLVHAPDLTIAGIGRRYGVALWNQPRVAMPLEFGLVALALVFYASQTRARGWRGHAALAVLAAALVAAQLVNWLEPQPEATLDPVPASTPLTALLAFAALAGLGFLAARFRTARDGSAVTSL